MPRTDWPTRTSSIPVTHVTSPFEARVQADRRGELDMAQIGIAESEMVGSGGGHAPPETSQGLTAKGPTDPREALLKRAEADLCRLKHQNFKLRRRCRVGLLGLTAALLAASTDG